MGSACSATIWLQNCLASSLTLGPHECDDGKWKIKKLHWHRTFLSPYEDGWVKTPVIREYYGHKDKGRSARPPSHYKPYPSGEIIPYHYKNPVSGR